MRCIPDTTSTEFNGTVSNDEADCRSLTPARSKKGASFAGVIGRTAGSVPGAKYSQAMKDSKIVWTPERIDAYITNPKKIVPGGSMKYDGLDDAEARADVIAFLVSKG